jgi:hypothetical protein
MNNEYMNYHNNIESNDFYNNTDIDNENYKGSVLLFFVSTIFCSYFFEIISKKIKEKRKEKRIEKRKDNMLKEKIINIESDIICSICLEVFEKNDKYIEFECKHIYHKFCIKEWLQNNNNCPNCRKIII